MTDPYRSIASRKFNVAYDDVTDEQRQTVKRALFYRVYGGADDIDINSNDVLEAMSHIEMTPEEREMQRQSFAWGNLVLDGVQVTREDIAAAAQRIRDAG